MHLVELAEGIDEDGVRTNILRPAHSHGAHDAHLHCLRFATGFKATEAELLAPRLG